MAEKGKQRQKQQEDSAADEAVAADTGKKKKKILLLAGLGLALLLVAGGLSWLALGLLSEETPAAEAAASAEPAKPEKAPALYLSLDPPFLANYAVGNRQQYVQVAVAVMAREQDALDGVNAHMPLIRNRLVMLMGGEQFSQLQTDQGREQLREKLLAAIREILQKEIGKPGVEQVLFTNFVMQ